VTPLVQTVVLIVLGLVVVIGLVVAIPTSRRALRGRRPGQLTGGTDTLERPRPGVDYAPGVGDDAETPRDTRHPVVSSTLTLPDADVDVIAGDAPTATGTQVETPLSAAGRLVRLRDRLSRSRSGLGRGLLTLLSRDHIDESTWEEVEDTLITADVGVTPTLELVDRLRTRVRVQAGRTPGDVREILREELLTLVDAGLDRSLAVARHDGRPAVVLVVGVNGAGKTTTVGKLARLLVAGGSDVLLGAADTFRAAAADQLESWGRRVGVPTVRGAENADPSSVAFEAAREGAEAEVDTVLVDTAGRLQNKAGLMAELGKMKRVLERNGPLDEVLLVLDATTGQNGLVQARVFAEAVAVTGIVLTKLDGTAKGGIVIAVQRELGVPVKLVGLGEGPDDLAAFEPAAFVDALLESAEAA